MQAKQTRVEAARKLATEHDCRLQKLRELRMHRNKIDQERTAVRSEWDFAQAELRDHGQGSHVQEDSGGMQSGLHEAAVASISIQVQTDEDISERILHECNAEANEHGQLSEARRASHSMSVHLQSEAAERCHIIADKDCKRAALMDSLRFLEEGCPRRTKRR